MASSRITLTIPDTLRFWPWPRQINPHYSVRRKESSEWCGAFNAFSPKEQEAFNKYDFNLLAALTYPLLDKNGYRIGCDLMKLFFIFNECTVGDVDSARAQAGIIMDAIYNPHKPRSEGEWIGGKLTQQFWLHVIKSATTCCQRRLIHTFQLYTDAIVWQAVDRNNNHIHDIDSYLEVRRQTIGAKLFFAILEIYTNLPDTVMNHPVIKKLTELCIDMIIIGKDLYSYGKERDHNLVTIVMHQLNQDPQTAMHCISNFHDNLASQFLDQWKKIPTFDRPLDLEVRMYCDGLANFVRAAESWSFESEHYFGKKGLEVQATRRIQLKFGYK